MSVIYIGYRYVGKTHLMLESCNPNGIYVKGDSPKYDELKRKYYDEAKGRTIATPVDEGIINREDFKLTVTTSQTREINVTSYDFPGEIYRDHWQKNPDNAEQWEEFKRIANSCKAIILVLAPHAGMSFKRGIDKKALLDADEIVTQEQFSRRLQAWVEFFSLHCPNTKHLLICLNKADLLAHSGQTLEQVAETLKFAPNGGGMDWLDRHRYVYHRYFNDVHEQLQTINADHIRCFLTSIYSRPLLELPWIYLANRLPRIPI
jgi:hypothetical protein